jgi:hypothetical protein
MIRDGRWDKKMTIFTARCKNVYEKKKQEKTRSAARGGHKTRR